MQNIVTVVYRPPTGDVKLFLKHLKYIQMTSEFSKMEKIILGHFNICYHDRENSKKKKKASTIDSFFTGSNFSRDSGCFTDQINDHQSMYMIRKKVRNPTHSNTVQGRSYTHFIQE